MIAVSDFGWSSHAIHLMRFERNKNSLKNLDQKNSTRGPPRRQGGQSIMQGCSVQLLAVERAHCCGYCVRQRCPTRWKEAAPVHRMRPRLCLTSRAQSIETFSVVPDQLQWFIFSINAPIKGEISISPGSDPKVISARCRMGAGPRAQDETGVRGGGERFCQPRAPWWRGPPAAPAAPRPPWRGRPCTAGTARPCCTCTGRSPQQASPCRRRCSMRRRPRGQPLLLPTV